MLSVDNTVAVTLVQGLQQQEHPLIVVAIAAALSQFAKYPVFSEVLVSTESLQAVLSSLILNQQVLPPATIEYLKECLASIIDNADFQGKLNVATVGLEVASTSALSMQLTLLQEQQDMRVTSQASDISPFDAATQFLHIHIYKLFFHEPVNPEDAHGLLLTLLTYRHSIEFNKLGLCALQGIVSSTANAPQALRELIPLFVRKPDYEEGVSILEALFANFISAGKQERLLALDVVTTLLEVVDELLKKEGPDERLREL